MANYSYLSDGTKRSAVGDDGEGFVYLGSLVYRISGDSRLLESCSSPGGRLVAQGPDASTFLPYYFLTDHLGSVRAVVAESHDGDRVLRTTLEHNDYYPFGSRWEDPESLLSDNRYRYNGKEEQAFVGLPYIDYGARQLLAPFHIWLTQDPLAEKYYALSPYAFCAGNPILFVDPDGADVWEINANGEVVNHYKDKTQDAFYMVQQVDGRWQRMNGDNVSLSFKYKTVKNVMDIKVTDLGGNTYDITIFEINGDENGQKLFEYMCYNSDTVEWSHSKVGTEDSGRNMVGTSHQVNADASGGYIYAMKYTIREHSHNHPNRSYGEPSEKDKKFAESLKGVPTYIYYGYEKGEPVYQYYNSNGAVNHPIPKVVNGKRGVQYIKWPIL